MQQETRFFSSELAIIGTGLAGFAASIFAFERGLRTAQVGNTGAVAYTTGYLDLLGQLATDPCRTVIDPWQSLALLEQTEPGHPLTRLTPEEVKRAFAGFTAFLSNNGIDYTAPGSTNLTAITPAGTLKTTLCVPGTMAAGVQALADKSRCVIVDFKGLKGFSGRQVAANLAPSWPGLRSERVAFPDMEHGEIYPEVMARALEVPAHREQLAEAIRAVTGDAEVVGMPAVLGMHAPDRVRAAMENLIGLPVFEVPTMPPSVPGIRLREMFEQVFPGMGMTLVPQQKVRAVSFSGNRAILQLSDNYGPITIEAEAVLLASGRFLSGGLHADMDRIEEPLLQIPVTQPATRDAWYRKHYMDRRGHGIHRTGIEVDDQFRPLGHRGEPVHERLFAAGAILAHQDWIRGRCGAGVAIASAYKAVAAVIQLLRGGS